jgi:hypothetical protein
MRKNRDKEDFYYAFQKVCGCPLHPGGLNFLAILVSAAVILIPQPRATRDTITGKVPDMDTSPFFREPANRFIRRSDVLVPGKRIDHEAECVPRPKLSSFHLHHHVF